MNYNANDARTLLTDNFGGSFNYNYFADGKLQSILNNKSEVYSFAFDDRNRLTNINRPGIDSHFSYSDKNAVMNISHQSGSTVKSFFNYSRTDEGFVSGMTTEDGNFNYQYDLNSFLVTATQPSSRLPGSNSSFATESFAYDSIGLEASGGGT